LSAALAPAADRLERALAAIDAANADDPNRLRVRGELRPKELAHAELASEWVEKLCDAPSEALRLAARAHHVRRWEIPREREPAGRAGYHRWRRSLQEHHARVAAEILADCGYAADLIDRVGALLRKRDLGSDPEAQTLEDALCLVFLETQYRELAGRLPEEKFLDVTRKTLRKMSDAAIARARALPLAPEDRALLERAARD
jgi:hypothetical protein